MTRAERLGTMSQPHVGVTQNLLVTDAEGLDPSLLPAGQCNEEPQFHQFRLREVLMELSPENLIGNRRIPDDCTRIAQRCLLAGGETIGLFELEKIVVVGLGEPFPSSLDGSLDSSIVTGD